VNGKTTAYRQSGAANKRNRLKQAVVDASGIDDNIDEERGDIYSIKRLEREF
jgi:hypothetical protein